MTSLYITADAIGTPTGGGKVTHHESQALASLDDETLIWQFPNAARPWGADEVASARLLANPHYEPARAHFYSGTFSKTIEILRARGTRVSYTAAAHAIGVSRQEHELLGMAYDYPHLTQPDLWDAYVRGYLEADIVVCPSNYSAKIMRGYGCTNVVVIPHGFDPPARIVPIPKRFVVGYLGQPGPDKGLRYLIGAWSLWNAIRAGESGMGASSTEALLILAGRGTQHVIPMVRELARRGSVFVRGEVAEPSDLYDACCVYVQPSASEGFGCEVLEARAHGRPVICSNGAGAHEHANEVVLACDSLALARAIDGWHSRWLANHQALIEIADPPAISNLTWDCIRARYVELFTR